jgi:MFS family permease
MFAVLFGINVLNYTDRYVLPAVVSQVKADLALSDTEIGLLGTAFLLVYAIAAIPAGVIADRFRRTTLIGWGVSIWSVATLLTGFTQSFGQIFGARALLGIGEATYFPPSTTILADAYPLDRRARLMSWWGLATPVGVFLGFAVGGLVGERLGWRSAFYFTALPGLILAILAAGLGEPRRGASERLEPTVDGEDWTTTVRKILGVRSLAFSILAQALGFFVLGGVSFWIPYYLTQHFGLAVGSSGLLSGALFVLGGGIGTLSGGHLADALLGRGMSSGRLLVPGLGFLASVPVIFAAVLTTSTTAFLILFFVAGGLLQMYSGPMTALSQDVIVPARRARAVALSLLIAHLLGDAFAPAVLGILSDALGGLQPALLVAPVVLVGAAALAFVGCRWVAGDRQMVLLEAGHDLE